MFFEKLWGAPVGWGDAVGKAAGAAIGGAVSGCHAVGVADGANLGDEVVGAGVLGVVIAAVVGGIVGAGSATCKQKIENLRFVVNCELNGKNI